MARPPRWLVVTSVLGALALGVAGAWFHFAQRHYLMQVASANLMTVAQAKLDQIVAWRADEFHHAANLQGSPLFVRAVERSLTGHQPGVTADLLAQLRLSLADSENDDVRLVDRAGRIVLATSGRLGTLDADEAAALRAAFRDRRPTMGDLHVSTDDSIPHLVVVAPLFASSGRSAEPIGAVVQVADPRRSLFRLVASWPSPSLSAEAMLVRRDGDSVLFLTARRFQPGAGPTPRIALSRRDVPAVMAVLGTEGVVRGVDYRRVRVISALRAVPGTPWFLVAKVDEAEALAVWRTRIALVFAVLLGLALLAAATAITVGQRSAAAHYRRLYEAEAALGASEERYRLLFDGLTDAAFVHALGDDDMPAEFLAVNDVACERLGYTREELLHLTVRDVDAPESTVDARAISRRLKRGETVLFEQTHVTKDGRRIPVEIHVQNFPLHGRPVALSVVRDITERKRVEEAIRESEARLRTVVEASLDAIVAVNVEGRIVLFNGAAQELFRYSREEALNQAAKILLREEVGEIHQERLERFLGEGVGQCGHIGKRIEKTFRRKDGSLFEAEVSMSGGRRNGLRLVVLAVHDITERKRAELVLRESEEQLKEAQRVGHLGSWNLNIVTGDLEWSDECYRIFGFRPQEFVPTYEKFRSIVHPEDLGFVQERVDAALNDDKHYDVDFRFVRPNGEVGSIHCEGEVRRAAEGKPLRFFGTQVDITERKRAEEALREREQELTILFEELPIGVSLLDQNRKMTYANPRLQEILGLSRDDLLQGKYQERRYLRSDGTPMPPEEFASARAFREQRPIHAVETGIVVEDGRTIWTSVSAAPFPVANKGVLIATADITERKRAEEALRASEERYRTILATALDGFWLADMQGRFLEVNDAYCRMSGYSRQELLAMSITDLEATETRAETAARIEKIRTHGADRFESRHRRKDGSIFDVHISVQFQPMEGGRMVVFVRDITERRRAEETLRESEERYRGIIEQLNDVYYRTDRDGRITMLSPSAAQLFGFPSTSEMIGRPIESLWQDPSQRAALLAAIDERGFVHDHETTAVRTDGAPFAVAVSSHYVRDASGAADGVEGIIRDITERKQSEAALRELARHLDSVREEEHTRIARQIHDELGQALTALRLDLTWVGRKIPKGNTALRRRIDAAVELTDETITVGQRIVEGLRPPILDDLGLVPALEWYVQHFAKRSGLRIEFDVGAEEPAVPDHLAVAAYRIVQEALTNVARHANATHARVRLGEQDGALTIEIRDDGQGLSEEVSRDPHSFGIVGMRERTASQGGELVITSSPGAGTTVRVTFPLERRAEPRVPR